MAEYDEGKLERAIMQRKLQRKFPHAQQVPITQVTRDGELLFVLPDGKRHERRIQRAELSDSDKLFWATVTVACGSPGPVQEERTEPIATQAKRYSHLAKARNDLEAYYQFYRPTMVGEPFTVGTPPGLGKSAGFFAHTIRLDNPGTEDLRTAILRLRQWLDTNQYDPEYTSFQLNFAFSGHGDLTDDGAAAIVLADKILTADKLASMLLWSVPKQEVSPAACRLDLFLDCCHAGAVARDLSWLLTALQTGVDPPRNSRLELGQLYCACLGDEEAFELEGIPHSLFTFAFLNECSRRRPEGAGELNLALRDIGWFTEGRQHPLLLDFTPVNGMTFKFPPLHYLTRGPAAKGMPPMAAALQTDPNADAADLVGHSLRVAAELRARTREVEIALASRPELRVEYSRQELLSNRKFPFL